MWKKCLHLNHYYSLNQEYRPNIDPCSASRGSIHCIQHDKTFYFGRVEALIFTKIRIIIRASRRSATWKHVDFDSRLLKPKPNHFVMDRHQPRRRCVRVCAIGLWLEQVVETDTGISCSIPQNHKIHLFERILTVENDYDDPKCFQKGNPIKFLKTDFFGDLSQQNWKLNENTWKWLIVY